MLIIGRNTYVSLSGEQCRFQRDDGLTARALVLAGLLPGMG